MKERLIVLDRLQELKEIKMEESTRGHESYFLFAIHEQRNQKICGQVTKSIDIQVFSYLFHTIPQGVTHIQKRLEYLYLIHTKKISHMLRRKVQYTSTLNDKVYFIFKRMR